MSSPSRPGDRRTLGAWQLPGHGVFVYANEPVQEPNSPAGQVSNPGARERSRTSRSFSKCSGSVTGHDNGDVHGDCTWCGSRVNSPVPRPELGQAYRTELDLAYRYHHDPDYGDDPYDT